MRNHLTGFIFFIACCVIFLSSCINSKSITYFNNLPDTLRIPLNTIEPPQQIIQVNDVLDVKVGGENEETVAYINQYFGSAAGLSGNALQCVVDIDGNIELPKIGKIKLLGFTRDQARDVITKAYAEFLKEPIISVRFGNFRFSVLGEVKNPGTYNVNNEKVNVFEAIAAAGDMTQFSRRNNVKIIRDSNGVRQIITLDFNDKSILNSPNYYLNRYDIMYVESNNVKSFTENVSRTATYVATISSLLALIFVIVKK